MKCGFFGYQQSDYYRKSQQFLYKRKCVSGGSVRLNYNDLCGITKIDGITVYSSCPPAFTVAPNPGVDNITVSADNSATAKMSSGALIYKIKITDRLGTIRKLMEYKTPVKSINISINRLEAGIYSISMYNGTVWSTQKLIVKQHQ